MTLFEYVLWAVIGLLVTTVVVSGFLRGAKDPDEHEDNFV
jgi:hypothetical protein